MSNSLSHNTPKLGTPKYTIVEMCERSVPFSTELERNYINLDQI